MAWVGENNDGRSPAAHCHASRDSDASVGAPFVDGALVTAEVVEQGRARKVIAFKKRRRQNSKRTRGHRQHRPECARGADPVSGQHHPAEADHRAESEREDVPVAEYLQQRGVFGLGCDVSVHGPDPSPAQPVRWTYPDSYLRKPPP